MRKILLVAVSFLVLGLVFGPSARTQAQPCLVYVHAILVDKDLNQKPVPHLAIQLVPEGAGTGGSQEAKTDFDGKAEFQVPAGKYRLATPQGVDFQARHYAWELEIDAEEKSISVDLSNDNARDSDSAAAQSVRKVDDLTVMFQKYQKSVVTV